MQQQLTPTAEFLMARFNKLFVPFILAAEFVGIPEQTARNKLAKGEFPIPTVLNGTRRQVHIQDMADYVDELRSAARKPSLQIVAKKKSSSRG